MSKQSVVLDKSKIEKEKKIFWEEIDSLGKSSWRGENGGDWA